MFQPLEATIRYLRKRFPKLMEFEEDRVADWCERTGRVGMPTTGGGRRCWRSTMRSVPALQGGEGTFLPNGV